MSDEIMRSIYNQDLTYNQYALDLDKIMMKDGLDDAVVYIGKHNLDVHQSSHLLFSMISCSISKLRMAVRLERCDSEQEMTKIDIPK